jgi:oligopeptidase B
MAKASGKKTSPKGKKAAARKTAPCKARGSPARRPRPPVADQRPVTRIVHGVELTDEYSWIKAENWQEVLRDPKVLPKDIRKLIEAENAYTDAILAPTKSLQKKLVREMRGRIKEDESEVPAPDGPYAYFQKYREGGQHPLICRRPREGGRPRVMLDGDKLAKGKPFFDLATAAHSPDHSRLGWSVDEKGSEFHTIRIRDLKTGRDLPDTIIDTDGGLLWTSDSSSFYYVRMDANHRPGQVFRHRIGDDPAKADMVFEEKDPAWFVHVSETQSGAFGTIEINDHETSESWLLDLRDPLATPRLVAPREHGVQYDVEHRHDTFFILTNADGAEDFKIVTAPVADPSRAKWVDFIPHRLGRMITGFVVFENYLVRQELEDGLPRIVIRDLRTHEEHAIAFDEEAYDLGLEDMLEFDTEILRFSYSSMTTPREVYDYDMEKRTRVLRKRQQIPSGHNPDDYVTRRVFAVSHDDELVPVSILYSKKTKLDGSAPCLLQGYGSYGHAYEASFGTHRFSLVDRGFVFAIAHIRGGTDKGWRWYKEGKLDRKRNTFLDFIAAGRHLADHKFTSEGRIVALGRSAGGMLMGAVANMAPNLFGAVVAGVPFVDVLNTMLDDTLPLTPPEWLEWGNPITDAKAFETIRSYSPYDNVKPQHYPAILALSGLTDPRVTYWEPTKWVARLRARMTGGGPVLLRTNMDAGHAGSAGRFDRLEELAIDYAFAITFAQSKLVA